MSQEKMESEKGEAVTDRTASYMVDRVDGEGYEPDMLDGAQVGESRGLAPAGSTPAVLDACLWRSEPATYDYLFEGDEALCVLEGAATVDLTDTGETVSLRTGDIAYFSAGTRSVWTITETFKKFTVIAT
jgi:hypothetical protein